MTSPAYGVTSLRDDDVTGGDDRRLGLPPRVVDVLRQMSPYADRLAWSVSENAGSVSLALVWQLRSSAGAEAAEEGSSWRGRRRPGPVDRLPAADSSDPGLLQRLRRRLDRLPSVAHVTGSTSAAARTSGGGGGGEDGRRGRGLLRRCVTSLTALRLWKARQSPSNSPSHDSSDRLDATTATKQRQQRQRQQTVGDDDLFCRSRFTTVQVSKSVYFLSMTITSCYGHGSTARIAAE